METLSLLFIIFICISTILLFSNLLIYVSNLYTRSSDQLTDPSSHTRYSSTTLSTFYASTDLVVWQLLLILPFALHPALGQRQHIAEENEPRAGGGLLQQSRRIRAEAAARNQMVLPEMPLRLHTGRGANGTAPPCLAEPTDSLLRYCLIHYCFLLAHRSRVTTSASARRS